MTALDETGREMARLLSRALARRLVRGVSGEEDGADRAVEEDGPAAKRQSPLQAGRGRNGQQARLRHRANATVGAAP
ncbi:hypothetical protein IP76_22215 [Rhizobium sp. AAP43]|nr:hypothetical protein IP76_22215 [Rhizobium sp. AAP43]